MIETGPPTVIAPPAKPVSTDHKPFEPACVRAIIVVPSKISTKTAGLAVPATFTNAALTESATGRVMTGRFDGSTVTLFETEAALPAASVVLAVSVCAPLERPLTLNE